jgi:hypothetical protein
LFSLFAIFHIDLALALMNTWKNYKVPTASELFWMIPYDENISEEVNNDKYETYVEDSFFKVVTTPEGNSIEQSGDYRHIEGSQRVSIWILIFASTK